MFYGNNDPDYSYSFSIEAQQNKRTVQIQNMFRKIEEGQNRIFESALAQIKINNELLFFETEMKIFYGLLKKQHRFKEQTQVHIDIAEDTIDLHDYCLEDILY